MPRRAIRLTTKPPDEETAAKYLRYWSQEDLHFHPEKFPKLDSPSLFGNTHSLELEVGCGTGEFLCTRAAQDPAANFLGIDIYAKALYKAVANAAEEGLDNILFIRAPVQFTYPLFAPHSLRMVYLHFPDPHIRSRGQHKIFNLQFLNAVCYALEPGGRLSVITDHREFFFEEMLPLIEADNRFCRVHEERYLIGYEPETKSRYQKMWEKHEVPPLRFVVEKRGGEERLE